MRSTGEVEGDSDRERRLISLFRQLNENGQQGFLDDFGQRHNEPHSKDQNQIRHSAPGFLVKVWREAVKVLFAIGSVSRSTTIQPHG